MKFVLVAFVFVSVVSMFVAVDAFSDRRRHCEDRCGDDFDEVVCAWNGETMRQFSGRCRLKQYNECYNDSKIKVIAKVENCITFLYRFQGNRIFKMPEASINSSGSTI